MLLVQIVRIPEPGIDAFRRFEVTVVLLLAEHGGALTDQAAGAGAERWC